VIPGRWTEHAACCGQTAVMAPPCLNKPYASEDRLTVRQRGEIAAARVLCFQCPVLGECTAWALDSAEDPAIGMVAAGMTPNQRRLVRNRRAS
jgi:hypothetical protein